MKPNICSIHNDKCSQNQHYKSYKNYKKRFIFLQINNPGQIFEHLDIKKRDNHLFYQTAIPQGILAEPYAKFPGRWRGALLAKPFEFRRHL